MKITIDNQKQPIAESANDYLETLERVKKEYQQYLEVSRLYELPIQQKQEEPEQHFLTSNTLSSVKGE